MTDHVIMIHRCQIIIFLYKDCVSMVHTNSRNLYWCTCQNIIIPAGFILILKCMNKAVWCSVINADYHLFNAWCFDVLSRLHHASWCWQWGGDVPLHRYPCTFLRIIFNHLAASSIDYLGFSTSQSELEEVGCRSKVGGDVTSSGVPQAETLVVDVRSIVVLWR